ncbi:PEP-CTERM sorting domain-containing protein [Limnospira fusiformis]|uniref:PEP-CTERM sorting domain-containing protein n=1 Tax=Limnospira fusiformis TaxID=54297 RepID=UPI002AA2739D|nr:PEP-CTERM sorting domain-containing protein [Limnospira fusiformis LS22]
MKLQHQVQCATVSLSIASLSFLAAAPAQALTFSPGDRFTANSIFTVIGDNSTSLNFDFLDHAGNAGGTTGNFGIHNHTATGVFVDYNTSSGIDSRYIIRDTDFGNTNQVIDFLRFDDGPGGLSEWSMDLRSISIVSDSLFGSMRFVNIAAEALFKSDNQLRGTGGFQGLIRIDQTNNTAQFDFETTAVPEPFTILGTGLAFGIAGLLKREYDKKKS